MDFIKYLSEEYAINLNSQQQQAVTNINGPILLLAVPGGGKTTVIVSRCANMILNHGIDPKNILTLTFSKASASDMEKRFSEIFGRHIKETLHFSTIHSFCYNVLSTHCKSNKMTFPSIIEDKNAPVTKSRLLRQINQEINNEYLADDKLEDLINGICYVKNKMLDKKGIAKFRIETPEFSKIYNTYQQYMTENNLIDFDDLLVKAYDVLRRDKLLLTSFKNRYTYINIDESQDTSLLQHKIIETLAKPENNIFLVGDEDQSIYSFRAAHPRALLDFDKTFPGARILLMEKNYRSSGKIVSAAAGFIKQNRERYDKSMTYFKDEGMPVKKTILNEREDQYTYIYSHLKKMNNYKETAVLFRNNISAIPLADILESAGIPFYIREGANGFFSHWITIDILSYFKLSQDLADIDALWQIYFKLNAYISKDMMSYAKENRRNSSNLFDILSEYPDIQERQKYKLMEIKAGFVKLSKMNPPQAIEYICHTMEYKKYLTGQNNDIPRQGENRMEIVGILKIISNSTLDLPDFISRLDSLQNIMDISGFNKHKNAVTISTIHSSKGLEFDKVFMIDLFDGQFPSTFSIKEAAIGKRSLFEEEVRLFYVGCTRARYDLELLSANRAEGKKIQPSRFIEELKANPVSKEYTGVQIMSGEIFPGKTLVHKKFGAGIVQFVNNKTDMVGILFSDSGLKKLSIEICLKNRLLLDPDKVIE